MSGTITFQGLGAGTDFGAMIDELRKVEEIQMNSMIDWRGEWEARVEAFDIIIAKMQELETITEGLSNMNEVILPTASSSNEIAVSATATDDSLEGTFAIEILQLASAEIYSTKNTISKVEDANGNSSFPPLGTSGQTFSYTHGVGDDAETVEITIDDSMTIEDLVERINNDSNNPGVKASLIPSGGGYLFQLQSSETGNTNAVDITTDIDAFAGGFNNKEAQDAEFVLNGFDEQVITSSTNKITDVVEGVTLDLKNTTVGSTTITVGRDTSQVAEKITEWVDAVNDMRKTLQELTEVDTSSENVDPQLTETQQDAQIGSILTGNYAVQLFESRMDSIVSSKAFGMEGESYSTMSQLGIMTEVTEGDSNYGLLVIDTEKLNAAIEDDPEAVANLLAGDSYSTESENFIYADSLDTVKPGKYDVTYSTDADGNIDPDTVYIAGIKARTDPDFPNRYTVGDSSSDAYGLSIKFTAGVLEPNQSYEGDSVSIIQGKAQELSQFFADEAKYIETGDSNGAIPIVRENYMDIIDNLNKKIADEVTRIDLWEERQRIRYASLDAYIGVQQALMTSNAEALAQANIAGN